MISFPRGAISYARVVPVAHATEIEPRITAQEPAEEVELFAGDAARAS